MPDTTDANAAEYTPVTPAYRSVYVHDRCGARLEFSPENAKFYHENPTHYGSLWCRGCRRTGSLGPAGEFVWADGSGKVGT